MAIPALSQPNFPHGQLLASFCLAVLGCAATVSLIPEFTTFLKKKGLIGKDLCKRGTDAGEIPVPEATGVVPGTIFLICVIFLQLFFGDSPAKMIDYQSALLSICFMTFLGFSDDVLDLPWRYKLILPTVATLPLLCAYTGSTTVLIPAPFTPLIFSGSEGEHTLTYLGHGLSQLFNLTVPQANGCTLVDLGIFFMVYMGLLAVFCTNAVNIYAGINGLEAGQCVVMACAILTHNFIEMSAGRAVSNHLFSAEILLPFVGATLGLLYYNWYPSKVFVGDTFCYFAGMTFAVVAIHGHFSKTLVLMFLPQWLNFFLSVPQLFKIVPCPRHRLPSFNAATGLLHPSTVLFPRLANTFLASGAEGHIINLTLINLVIHITGPMKERNLCITLLVLQACACAFGFVIRYHFVNLVYYVKE